MPSSDLTSPQGEEGQPGKWIDIDSSSISSVAFDKNTGVLKVKFPSGKVYEYNDVPLQKFKNLVYAASSGNYFRKDIVPHHEGTPVHNDE